jgi:hypothetical protein
VPGVGGGPRPDRVNSQTLGELMDLFVGHRAFLCIGAV